ncbi:calcium-responsive transcription factor-like isoform X2 [Dysidea avara]|uniref:calcium-responsive transcription factor-like isoform X2 n=1 Tax=Dysidea avara TaxID=196820 RepID=UPI00333399D9
MSTTRSTLPATLPAWGLFLNDVHVKDGFVNGFLSEADIDKVLDLHGRACLTDYVKSHVDNFEKRHKNRGESSRLLWSYGTIPADGTPFIVISSQELQCQRGQPKKYHVKEEERSDHVYDKKPRTHLQKGRKEGCPATGCVKKLLKFPSHTIPVESKRSEKQRVINDLKEKLASKSVEGLPTYFVTLPMESVHNHKLIGATRRMNSDIRNKVQEFVSDNITNTKLIKRLLRKYVQRQYSSDVVKPHVTDRSYYPHERDITNCVHSIMSAGKYSHLDQLNLEKIVTDWIVSDTTKPIEERTKVYYRKSSTEFEGDALSSVEAVIGTIET